MLVQVTPHVRRPLSELPFMNLRAQLAVPRECSHSRAYAEDAAPGCGLHGAPCSPVARCVLAVDVGRTAPFRSAPAPPPTVSDRPSGNSPFTSFAQQLCSLPRTLIMTCARPPLPRPPCSRLVLVQVYYEKRKRRQEEKAASNAASSGGSKKERKGSINNGKREILSFSTASDARQLAASASRSPLSPSSLLCLLPLPPLDV